MRIIGLAGWSGSGKTTLLTKLIPRLIARGLAVSTVKHAHHGFDVDQPGKDSHSHRVAGATEVLVGSATRWALVHELRGAAEPTLGELLAKLAPVDLVIVEGYKREPHPKLEVHRPSLGKPLIHPDDPAIVAVASDAVHHERGDDLDRQPGLLPVERCEDVHRDRPADVVRQDGADRADRGDVEAPRLEVALEALVGRGVQAQVDARFGGPRRSDDHHAGEQRQRARAVSTPDV